MDPTVTTARPSVAISGEPCELVWEDTAQPRTAKWVDPKPPQVPVLTQWLWDDFRAAALSRPGDGGALDHVPLSNKQLTLGVQLQPLNLSFLFCKRGSAWPPWLLPGVWRDSGAVGVLGTL